jgi:catechol 2,3-dioxygenase-like lactoylglutathione lyase family enzyme
MIGRLRSTVIDCPDPHALAAFYSELLGMHVVVNEDDWVKIRYDSDAPAIAFQKAPGLQKADWPDPARPQQLHLDVTVDDIELAEKRVLALGAVKLDGAGDDFRVYADPAGHPFCLVF